MSGREQAAARHRGDPRLRVASGHAERDVDHRQARADEQDAARPPGRAGDLGEPSRRPRVGHQPRVRCQVRRCPVRVRRRAADGEHGGRSGHGPAARERDLDLVGLPGDAGGPAADELGLPRRHEITQHCGQVVAVPGAGDEITRQDGPVDVGAQPAQEGVGVVRDTLIRPAGTFSRCSGSGVEYATPCPGGCPSVMTTGRNPARLRLKAASAPAAPPPITTTRSLRSGGGERRGPAGAAASRVFAARLIREAPTSSRLGPDGREAVGRAARSRSWT